MKHTLAIITAIFFSVSCSANDMDYKACGIEIKSHYLPVHQEFVELTVLVDQASIGNSSCAEITTISVSNYEVGELFQFKVLERKAEFFVKLSRSAALTSTLDFSFKNKSNDASIIDEGNHISIDISDFLPN